MLFRNECKELIVLYITFTVSCGYCFDKKKSLFSLLANQTGMLCSVFVKSLHCVMLQHQSAGFDVWYVCDFVSINIDVCKM